MNIVIEIDELVLHGFPPADRNRIGEAVQAELQRASSASGACRTRGPAAVRLQGWTEGHST